jgi:hypothetical protein
MQRFAPVTDADYALGSSSIKVNLVQGTSLSTHPILVVRSASAVSVNWLTLLTINIPRDSGELSCLPPLAFVSRASLLSKTTFSYFSSSTIQQLRVIVPDVPYILMGLFSFHLISREWAQ